MLPIKKMVLNLAQLFAVAQEAKTLILEWGRGTGKSTILAWYMLQYVLTMPRGKFYLAGTTFKAMQSDTLPSTFEGLERLGFYRGIHFHVGRPGPKHWLHPYQAPSDWSNFIHFYTGAAFQMVSQDKGKVEQRGPNYDGGIGDEVAQLNERRLMNECHAGMRTWREQFKKSRYYLTKVYASSTPVTREGQWFLKYEQHARENSKEYAFLRANARIANRHNLSPTWFDQMRADAPSQMVYDAEIENIRPNLVVNGFYPKLESDRHYYTAEDRDMWLGRIIDAKPFTPGADGDMDYDTNKPLIINFDPGSAINVVVVKQIQEKMRELRTINCFWLKHPHIIQDLFIEKVLPYYKNHKYRIIDLFFDRTARSRVANSRTTVADDVVALLRKEGWRVRIRQPKRVVTQDEKFRTIAKVHAEGPDDQQLYKSRINKGNCRDLIISMENAEAKESTKMGIRRVNKNKLSEQRKGSVPRQHATDLSDAYDLSEHYYATVKMKGEKAFQDMTVVG